MRILVVDDEQGFRQVFAEILTGEGYEVRDVGDSESAYAAAREFDPAVLVVDWMLRDGSRGPDVARRLREQRADLGVVLVTGFHASELDGPATELGAHVLQKPFHFDELLAAVSAVRPDAADEVSGCP